MFEVLSPALDAFISRCVEPELPSGARWVKVVAAVDNAMDRDYSPGDAQVQLKLISQN
jgi:hypothetical protein